MQPAHKMAGMVRLPGTAANGSDDLGRSLCISHRKRRNLGSGQFIPFEALGKLLDTGTPLFEVTS